MCYNLIVGMCNREQDEAVIKEIMQMQINRYALYTSHSLRFSATF